MSLQSMTGFGTVSGEREGISWSWEVRSVNGRGLDVRVRLPEGAESLEPKLRAELPKHVSRGNVSVHLKLSAKADSFAPKLIEENLASVIDAAKHAEAAAKAAGLALSPTSIGDLFDQKWIWDSGQASNTCWLEDAGAQIKDVMRKFVEAREAEGKVIAERLSEQTAKLQELARAARDTAGARNAKAGDTLREKVKALLDITDVADETRLAQELAVLAVKSDVTEELDRLDAHIAAAQELLQVKGPIGRKFDFLMQELNREANTLCSKSGDSALTAIGLELKVVIDQMREQVQNLE